TTPLWLLIGGWARINPCSPRKMKFCRLLRVLRARLIMTAFPCNCSIGKGQHPMRILVTGGAGFIGSAVCRHLVSGLGHAVVNVDALTYAANLSSLASIDQSPLYVFE